MIFGFLLKFGSRLFRKINTIYCRYADWAVRKKLNLLREGV
jgi:hypothetical protein